MWISYPITAAGPQRICTVFPILPSQQQATREPKSDDENIAPCVDCQSFCEVAMRDHKWEYVRKKPSHGFSPISTDSIQQLRVSLTQRQLQSSLFHTQVAATDSACAGNSLASRMGNRTKSGMERNHISCRRTNWRVCAFTWSIIMASPILPFMNSNGSL